MKSIVGLAAILDLLPKWSETLIRGYHITWLKTWREAQKIPRYLREYSVHTQRAKDRSFLSDSIANPYLESRCRTLKRKRVAFVESAAARLSVLFLYILDK
jgi:hypothetical protein